MIRKLSYLLFSVTLISPLARADEGMWLYNAFPSSKVKAAYGFSPTQAWLDNVRLSSVRFNNGGSGSFVSSDGLAFTNHHVGLDCIQSLSSGGKDYLKNGFYAASRAEEAKCPDLELNQVVEIQDVTARVKAAVKPEMSSAQSSQAQRAAMSAIEKDCATAPTTRCDVVTFYSGEVYHLYKYKKYTDIRLVFAPEGNAAAFGGDPDNFTFPRYDLDISYFRVYENGQPVHPEHYLRWSRDGVKDGELVFASGNPGSTGRLKTLSQLEYLRDVDYPARLVNYKHRIALLQQFSTESPENARIAAEDILLYQNSQKAFTGYLEGLQDAKLMARKTAEEQKLRTEYAATAKAKADDPWDAIAKAMQVQRQIYLPLTYLERMRAFNSDLAGFARTLVRVTAEKAKPNQERLREYRDSALPSLEQSLFSAAPIYKQLETLTLADSLGQAQSAFGADSESIRKILQGKTPDDYAKEAITATHLDDVAVRRQLYEGGAAAVQASSDPLIVLMRNIDAEARAARKQYDDEVDAVERTQGTLIAHARFAQSGFTQPPDATFTLRLSYGAVKGYTENGKQLPYFTTMGEGFAHSAEHDNKPPFDLPQSWFNAKSKVKLSTPLNFVSTIDIIGGSSGSPVVDRDGDLVGIIFDGNLKALPWNFVYDDTVGRAISVDARGIQEALRKIYNASRLADELLGKH